MNAYWNSGIFFVRKDSIINSFINLQPEIFKFTFDAVQKSKLKNNVYYLKKSSFNKIKEISFDYAILEKHKKIVGIKTHILWSDMGSWKELYRYFKSSRSKKYIKKNSFYRPWGKYVNLFNGKGFLLKEIIVNPRSSISLQKHQYRSEKWTVIAGNPKITINNRKFFKKPNESVEIPKGAKHRIENPFKKPVKIAEVQIGSILKESDITRFSDIYGRV